MTEHDRRTFFGSLAALFAGFRIAGASELDLVRATDQFLEDPEGYDDMSTPSSESTELSTASSRARSGDSHCCKYYDCKDCPKQHKCNFFKGKASR